MGGEFVLGRDVAMTLLVSLGLGHLFVREIRVTMACDDIMRMSLDCLVTRSQAAVFIAALKGQEGRVYVEVCPMLPAVIDDDIG